MALLAAVTKAADHDGGQALRMALWRAIVDNAIDADARFAMATQLLQAGDLPDLKGPDMFEAIALEATQAALHGESPAASTLAVACVKPNGRWPVSPGQR